MGHETVGTLARMQPRARGTQHAGLTEGPSLPGGCNPEASGRDPWSAYWRHRAAPSPDPAFRAACMPSRLLYPGGDVCVNVQK